MGTYFAWAVLSDSICLCLCCCKLFRGGIGPEPFDKGKIQFILLRLGRNRSCFLRNLENTSYDPSCWSVVRKTDLLRMGINEYKRDIERQSVDLR